MKDYAMTHLNEEIRIDHLATVRYFECAGDDFFPGEVHDYWELMYLNRGEAEVTAGDRRLLLRRGEILLYRPKEFHNFKAVAANPPAFVLLAFDCRSPAMRFFPGRILPADHTVHQLFGAIFREAGDAFVSDLGDLDRLELRLRPETPFGCLQVIRLCLELLLVHLVRTSGSTIPAVPSFMQERPHEEIFSRVVLYLERNLHNRITLEDVCRENHFGRSYLQKVFRDKSGGGVMEYFGRMKIEEAKRRIREGDSNFTMIASELGYASIHYFSRHFKKVTGITPTEYAASVKLRGAQKRRQPVFCE